MSTQVAASDLAGRMARCPHCGETQPSSRSLAFFEYRGPGSERAGGGRPEYEQCRCGYYRCAHDPGNARKLDEGMPEHARRHGPHKTVVEQGLCAGFVPAGPAEFDVHYNGCRGWD